MGNCDVVEIFHEIISKLVQFSERSLGVGHQISADQLLLLVTLVDDGKFIRGPHVADVTSRERPTS